MTSASSLSAYGCIPICLSILKLPEERNLNPSCSSQIDVSGRCPKQGEESWVSRRAPEYQHKGIPATLDIASASSGAQIKCLYVNTSSMWNKQ